MSVLPYAVKVVGVKDDPSRRPKKPMVFVMAEDGHEFPIPFESWPGGEAAAAASAGKWFMIWCRDSGISARSLRGAPRLPRRPEVTHLRCRECGWLMGGMENAHCGSSCQLNRKYARHRPPESIIVETYALKRTRTFAQVVKPFLDGRPR